VSVPDVSIVIPIHNEEPILTAALLELRDRLEPCAWSREILLAENGSRDRTAELARASPRSRPSRSASRTMAARFGSASSAPAVRS
jgi:glycosyltransferase involved in cell wall biosynthesis